MAEKEKEMSFLDHVEVLRWHLVRSTGVVFLFSIVAFIMKDFVFGTVLFAPKDADFITYRFFCKVSKIFGADGLCIEDIPFTFQSLAMAEQFSVHIWTSLTVGFIVAFPFIVWEFWKFISPGLYEKERKGAFLFIIISSFLFFVGVLFGYYIVTPLSVNFLGNYSVNDIEWWKDEEIINAKKKSTSYKVYFNKNEYVLEIKILNGKWRKNKKHEGTLKSIIKQIRK